MSVGAGAEVVGPRALLPLPLLPSTKRDGAEELWLAQPLAPRCSRRFTTGGAARALGGEAREVASSGKVLRRNWAEPGAA